MADDQAQALAKLIISGIAAGRVAIGVVATTAPAAGARFQFGAAAPALTITVRMLGARDLGLGVGALVAVRDGGAPLQLWTKAGVLADAFDALAFVRNGRSANARGSRLTAVVAAAAAVCGAWAARRLE